MNIKAIYNTKITLLLFSFPKETHMQRHTALIRSRRSFKIINIYIIFQFLQNGNPESDCLYVAPNLKRVTT